MSAATTTVVTVKWGIETNYTFAISVDGTNAGNQFKIAGSRDTETEARSACCERLTVLSRHFGIPLSQMVEVAG